MPDLAIFLRGPKCFRELMPIKIDFLTHGLNILLKILILQKSPTCYVIAGPNGAGKTTFAMTYLPKIGCLNFLNADNIARGLSPLNVESALPQASRIFLQMMTESITARKDFSFETTLSGKAHLQTLKRLKATGWRIELFYLWLPNAGTSALRVEYRVKQGGHDVPRNVMIRRFPRSIANLAEYVEVCDTVCRLDNSRGKSVILAGNDTTALAVLQEAVHEELSRKTRLGQRAVVCDENGNPKVVSARCLLRKLQHHK